MKKIHSIILLTLAFLLGAGVAIQTVRLRQHKERTAAALTALEESSRQVERLKAEAANLKDQKAVLRCEVNDLRHELAAKRSGLVPVESANTPETSLAGGEAPAPDQKAGPLGGMLAKMLDDPEMKQFIRSQQRQMMDSLYEPLINRLGLTPEEGEVFKDYLADVQMSATRQAGSLFGGSPTNRAEAVAAMSAEQKQADEALKVFLGEEGYAQYKDYQETLGERMQLNQFRMQSTSEHAMTEEQTEWLLDLMREEKRAAAAGGQTLPRADQDAAGLEAMLSGENAEQLLRTQETVNQRVYERAREGLSPDQLEAFGRFQTNQLQTMRMGLSMARKMFAPEPGAGNAAP